MGIGVELCTEGWLTRQEDAEPPDGGEGGGDFGRLVLGSPAALRARSQFRLIRYIDPYGMTIFNRIQMDDFLADLDVLESSLRMVERRSEWERGMLRRTMERVRTLAERCHSDVHTFLMFTGD